MIAEEADGMDHDGLMSLLAQRGEGGFYGWPDPGAARHALALECEEPVVRAETGCLQQRCDIHCRALGFD
jgi:hypothetical protein